MEVYSKKKIALISLFIILFPFIMSGCNSLTTNSITNKWAQDIDFIEKTLPEKDPNLSSKVKLKKFNAELNSLKKETNNLDDEEIQVKLAQIITSIGDAHTTIEGGIFSPIKIYPLALYWFNKDLYVLEADSQYKNLLACQLIKINNIPINEIADSTNKLIPHENDSWLKNQNPYYILNPQILKSLKIIEKDNTLFTFRNIDGKEFEVLLSPQSLKNINFVKLESQIKVKPLRNEKTDYYWYKYIPEEDILYFQYNVCMNKSQLKKMYPNDKSIDALPDFEQLSTEMIKIIKEGKVKKFVMDLRYNIGGDSRMGTAFIKNLNEAIAGHNIKVYGLIGRSTFSSGVWNALDLKNNTNAQLIGEATGGSPHSYGNTDSNSSFILPNSKLMINYTTMKVNISNKYTNTVVPDKEVELTFRDYMSGYDPLMDMVIKN